MNGATGYLTETGDWQLFPEKRGWTNTILGKTAATLTPEGLEKMFEEMREMRLMPPPAKVVPRWVYDEIALSEARWKAVGVLRRILKNRLPYFLANSDRPTFYVSGGWERYPWVNYRCKYQAEKGRKKFRRMHC